MQIFELAGKGLTVFDNLLAEYQMRLTGQRKLSGPGIKILDRASMGIVRAAAKKEADDSSSDSSVVDSDEETEEVGGWGDDD
jgi:hypothetical protein